MDKIDINNYWQPERNQELFKGIITKLNEIVDEIGSNPVRDGKVTKEDVRKVLDEPLDSSAFDQALQDGKEPRDREFSDAHLDAMKDSEEKEKIKAEIRVTLIDIRNEVPTTAFILDKKLCRIKELLEKL